MVQLETWGFRNLGDAGGSFGPGSHLFLGDNGAGKTSLLEAIYMLATTRSFRTSQVADCCRHGADQFRLRGEVDRERRVRLELGWQSKKRWRTVNSQQTSLAEHLSVLPAVSWSAADVEVLSGPPVERRRLLDRGVVGRRPAAIDAIARYRRALHAKRRLLVQDGERGDHGTLETWNRVLAEAAAELIRLRSTYCRDLGRRLGEVLTRGGLDFPPIELRYQCSPKSGCAGAEAVESELRSVRERECRLQQALVGPHRDDLEVLWDGRPARRVTSAGERKALGLALLAAQGEILAAAGRKPIYLLDDADTELDRRRLGLLWGILRDCGQLFVTSNRPQVWETLAIDHRWRLSGGALTSA